MLQSVDIDSDSFLEKISVVYVDYILLNQGITSFTSVKCLTIIGILGETR